MMAAGMAGEAEKQRKGAGGQGGTSGGLTRDPRVLAATAAGLASAVVALWGFRGLPLGSMLLWLSPLPLFLAGLGFGLGALAVSVAIAVLVLLLAGNLASLGIWLAGTGLPVAALLLAGLGRGGGRRLELSWPLALLGLYPAAVILLAAVLLGQEPGGLEGVLRRAVEFGLDRMGLDVGDAVVAELVRVKAAAVSFWISVALVANAAAARGLLERLGLGDPLRGGTFAAARLPRLYPALPAAVALLWLATAGEGVSDAVPLSLLLVLLLPVFLQGLGALHVRSRTLRGRTAMLVLLYALLLLFSVPTALLVTALGLVEHWGRRAPAPPPHS